MKRLTVALVLSALVLAGCGSDDTAQPAITGTVKEVCPSGASPTLLALEPASGNAQWSYCPAERSLFAVLGATADVVVAVSSNAAGTTPELVAVDARSGAERWRVTIARQQWAEGPFAGSGVVVALIGADLVGLDVKSGRERWRVASTDAKPVANTDSIVVVAGAATGPVVMMPGDPSSSPGIVRGLDRATGKERWSLRLLVQDPSGIGVARSPAAVSGTTIVVPAMVFAASSGPSQQVVAIDTAKGAELWRAARIDHPSAADGVIVGRSGDQVVALDATSGARLWAQPGVPSYGEIWSLGDGVVYALAHGEGSGVIAAYDLRTGATRWRFSPSSQLSGEPMGAADGRVFVGWESSVGALSARDGATNWVYRPRLVAPSWITGLAANATQVFLSLDNFAPTD